MPTIASSVLVDQADALGGDLSTRIAAIKASVREVVAGPRWAAISNVILTGDGDSFHAGLATEAAFAACARVRCTAAPAQRLLDHMLPWLDQDRAAGTLVVGASASGATERVAQCLTEARARGATTLAVTGAAGSAVADAAAHVLAIPPARLERSPGILTYQATLASLLGVAVGLGRARNALNAAQVAALWSELDSLGAVVAATNDGIATACADLAGRLARTPTAGVLGTGPSEGTARYAAAKLIEGAGHFAYGQDLEEWWHVERFARPTDTPLVVLAPPGRSRARALRLAREATALGRDVAIATELDLRTEGLADCLRIPVAEAVRDEFSPLVYHVFAARTAAHLADILGRSPFLGDLST